MGFSSWGAEGYGKVWLNAQNAAFYRHQHHAERRFERLLDTLPEPGGAIREALVQAGRELLLAQSSDWAFIVTNATSVPYAVRRFREHLHRFHRLCDEAERDAVDVAGLADIRSRDPIFPWLDLDVFRRDHP